LVFDSDSLGGGVQGNGRRIAGQDEIEAVEADDEGEDGKEEGDFGLQILDFRFWIGDV
jgi:hypothetical protein